MKESVPVPLNAADNWIARLKANDDQVLRTIYESGYPGIRQYVLQNSGTEDDAKDIYQEAFITMWRNVQLGKVHFSEFGQLQGYLFRIAQFKWLDQLRSSRIKNTKSLTDTEIEADIATEMDPEAENYIAIIKRFYASMGNPCKDVLHRFYFLKQSMAEIALFYSWTEPTAKNNKYRCLQKLRQMIAEKINIT